MRATPKEVARVVLILVRCRVENLRKAGWLFGCMLDIATGTIATASAWRALFGGHIFACLLYGAFYAESLHILIGGYLRVDVVSFDD